MLHDLPPGIALAIGLQATAAATAAARHGT